MPDKVPLIQPGECVLLLVDLQAGLAFGVSSEDRQTLVNNAIALARTAVVFGLPVVRFDFREQGLQRTLHAGHRQDIAVGTADRTAEPECLGG